MKSKSKKIVLGDTEFNVEPKAAKRLKQIIFRARYSLRLPYRSYPYDIEIAFRDYILTHQKNKKTLVSLDLVRNAESTIIPQSSVSIKDKAFIAKEWLQTKNHHHIEKYGHHFPTVLRIVFALLATACIVALIVIARAAIPQTSPPDSIGGPLNTQLYFTRTALPTNSYLPLIALCGGLVILAILFATAALKKTRIKSLVIASCVVLSLSITSVITLSITHPVEYGLPTDTYISACNSKVNFVDISNVQNGSDFFYEKLRNGWKLDSLLPIEATNFNNNICDYYFSLLSKYSNESIVLLPVIKKDGNITPYFFSEETVTDRPLYGWFVKP